MSGEERKVIVMPCSGIGKSYGAISREAAYEVVDELRPNTTRLVALSLLVLGDEERRAAVSRDPVIAIDGCPKLCAATMAEKSGAGRITRVSVLDVQKRHRELKPQGIAQLNEDGLRMARILAAEVAGIVDQEELKTRKGGDR